MALTKPQIETKELSEKSGDILVRFANARLTAKAIRLLHQRFYRAFNVILFNAKKVSRRNEELVRNDQQRLKKLFDELEADKTLEKSETIREYNTDYYCLCHGQLFPDARYQDQTHLLEELEAKGGTNFAAVLAILVFQYLKDENRKQIKKCKLAKCGKHFLTHNKRGEFCCVKHRVAQHRLKRSAQAPPQIIDAKQPPVMPQSSESLAMTYPVS
jgi:hypothetical protein